MRSSYRKNWNRFRDEVLEQDDSKCVRCGRSKSGGATLQIHHKEYLPGKQPWEYPYSLCETLCKGCHAKHHGKIQPDTGWNWVGYEDLGGLDGVCEFCGTSIRYVFLIEHPRWPSLEVGEYCCDHLTLTTEASDGLREVKRQQERRNRFINSKRWQPSPHGWRIVQKGYEIILRREDAEYLIQIDGKSGKQRFQTANYAKSFLYDRLETGEIEQFMARVTRKV